MIRMTSIVYVLVVACALLAGANVVWTQDAEAKDDVKAQPGMDMASIMEQLALAQPGPEHEVLASRAGEWTTEVSMFMTPEAPPQTQAGTASAQMILGGRFLEVISDGDFMGTPFESRSYIGFDRRHGEYTTVGFDTLGTYWVSGQGERDEDGVIRMHGRDADPTGEQVFTFEYEILGPDEHEYRVVFHQIGPVVYEEPFTMVKVRSTRKTD